MTPRVAGPLAALRDDLSRVGYRTSTVEDFLGPVAAGALHREQLVPVRRATAGDEPLATLVRFFTLGMPVAASAIDRALPSTRVTGLVELGLAEPAATGDRVRPLADLRPYGDESHDWWVASDLSELATGGPLRQDHVLGIGGASTTLASWTPRRPAARALDMGAGCGVQSLHLSTHCGHVVATDLSGRACEYTRFNLALNQIDNVEVRKGSLFEPVAGEQFDLIVSNPPFVITPRRAGVPEFEYRDGGMVGDDLVRTVVQSVEPLLASGGIAQLLGNWEVRAGQDWTDVVNGWLASTRLDAWVVQRERQDPAEYAELWSRDGGHRPGTAAYERLYDAWLDDFAARAVEWVGFGILTLAKPPTPDGRVAPQPTPDGRVAPQPAPDGRVAPQGRVSRPPLRRIEEVTTPVASPMGPAVDAGLRAQVWAAENDVFEQRWVVAPDVTEERYGRPGQEDPSIIRVTRGGGLRDAIQVDTATAAFLSVADGELTARQAFEAIAHLLEVDAHSLIEDHREVVRALVERGFLVSETGL